MNLNPFRSVAPKSRAVDTFDADPEQGFGNRRNVRDAQATVKDVVDAGKSVYQRAISAGSWVAGQGAQFANTAGTAVRDGVEASTGLKIPAWKGKPKESLLPTTKQQSDRADRVPAPPRKDDVV